MNRNEKHRGHLERVILLVIGLLALSASPALAQTFAYRIDPPPVMTTGGNVPVGGFPTAFLVPNASIKLCSDSACAVRATAYADATGNTPCGSLTPVTLPGTNVCTATAGAQGQFGFWIAPGTYYYTVTTTAGTFGPYAVSSPNDFAAQLAAGITTFNNRQYCATGATYGAKFVAAAALLPSTGGVVDCSSLQGAQTITSNMFFGITKPITLITGCATVTYSAMQTLPSNLTILDPGRCTTFIQAPSTNLANSFQTAVNATNIKIDGVTFDGNMANNTGAGQSHLFEVQATGTNIIIQNSTFQNFYGLTGSTGVCLSIDSATNALIQGNTVVNCGGVGHTADGIYTSGTRNRVIGNYISACTDTAIPSEVSVDPVISDNVIVNCPQGITADSAVVSSTGTGAIISNNVITGGGAAVNGGQIWVFKGAGTAQSRVVISGNIIKSTTNSRAILVENSSYVAITGNIVTDTTVFDGVRVANSDNVTITGNTSNLAGAIGYYLDTDTNVVLAGNTANDNSVTTIGISPGFYVHNGSNILISGNQAHDTRGTTRQVRGLLIDGTATNVFVAGNDFRFNQTDPGYSNTSSGNVRVCGNLASTAANTNETCDYVKITGQIEIANGKTITLDATTSAVSPTIGVTAGGDTIQLRGPTSGFQFVNNAGTATTALLSDGGVLQIGNSSGSNGGGVLTDGGGFKHSFTTAGCTTAAVAGAVCTTVVTWTTAFADTNETVVCQGRGTAAGVPANGSVLVVAGTATHTTVAVTGVAAGFNNIDCIAVHQ